MIDQNTQAIRFGVLISALMGCMVLSCLIIGCESSDGTQSLGIDPASSTMDLSASGLSLTVVSGTGDLSFPLEWSVSNSELGSIVGDSGYGAVYNRTSSNGENIVTVRDQYGAEGVAVITQVTETTEESSTSEDTTDSTTDTTTDSTTDDATTTSEPYISSVSGDTVTIENVWSDGTPWVIELDAVDQEITGTLGSETHTAISGDIVWSDSSGTALVSFTLTVDGSTTLTYP